MSLGTELKARSLEIRSESEHHWLGGLAHVLVAVQQLGDLLYRYRQHLFL